jgi:iron(III) transport system substrate-binding protein
MMHRITVALAALWLLSWPVAAANADDPPAVLAAAPENVAALRQTIAAAKAEGAFNYWDAVIQPETHDALSTAFRKAYGLPASFAVNYTLSPTLGLVTKVEQEVSAHQVSMDVAAVAVPTWIFAKVKQGAVLHYESPQYRNYAKAFAAGLGEDGYFAPNGAYMFVPAWNADEIDFKGTSFADFLDAVPAGQFSVGDAAHSETLLATFIGLSKVLGPDYFKALAAKKPAFIVRSELIAERMVTGQDKMAFSGALSRVFQSNERGAHLRFIVPTEGVVLLPAGMFILAEAKHPNVAKLWVDFILSEQGQEILSGREALISARSGFTSPLPEYSPSIDSLKLIPMDWKAMTVDELHRYREQWVAIFNP